MLVGKNLLKNWKQPSEPEWGTRIRVGAQKWSWGSEWGFGGLEPELGLRIREVLRNSVGAHNRS